MDGQSYFIMPQILFGGIIIKVKALFTKTARFECMFTHIEKGGYKYYKHQAYDTNIKATCKTITHPPVANERRTYVHISI